MDKLSIRATELLPGDIILPARITVHHVTMGDTHARVHTEKGYPVGYKHTDRVTVLRPLIMVAEVAS